MPVKAGFHVTTNDNSGCEWDSQDESAGVAVGVTVQPYDDAVWKALSSAQNATAVTGLGDAAFKGVPHAGDLSIKVGNREIDLGTIDFKLDNTTVDAANLTLAKLVLSRI